MVQHLGVLLRGKVVAIIIEGFFAVFAGECFVLAKKVIRRIQNLKLLGKLVESELPARETELLELLLNIAGQQIVHLLNPVVSLFTCHQLIIILLSLIEVELKLLQPVNLLSIGLEYALVDQTGDGLVALLAAQLVVEPEPERLREARLDSFQHKSMLAPVARPPDQVLVQIDDCLHLAPDLDGAQLRVES